MSDTVATVYIYFLKMYIYVLYFLLLKHHITLQHRCVRNPPVSQHTGVNGKSISWTDSCFLYCFEWWNGAQDPPKVFRKPGCSHIHVAIYTYPYKTRDNISAKMYHEY